MRFGEMPSTEILFAPKPHDLLWKKATRAPWSHASSTIKREDLDSVHRAIPLSRYLEPNHPRMCEDL